MKTKILWLASNPHNTDPLRLSEEIREIKESLKLSKNRDNYELIQGDAVRVKDLRRLVLEEQPHLIHFSGHGTNEGLSFEDAKGNTHQVTGDELAGLFKHFDSVQAVILNACYSEKQAHAIAEVTPYVIGMNKPIKDEAAIVFSMGFYDAIVANQTIETAFDIAVNALEMAESSHARQRSLKFKGQIIKAETQAQHSQAQRPVLLKGKISRKMPNAETENTKNDNNTRNTAATTSTKVAWIGSTGVIAAAIIAGIFTWIPSNPTSSASPPATGISSQSGAITISSSDKGQTQVVTDNGMINNGVINKGVINHYYDADPEEVNRLKNELNLKNRTIETLLKTIDNKHIPTSERTEKFKELATKYKALQDRLKEYENNPEIKQQVREALETGDLDHAEQLLEEANRQDEKYIQRRQQIIADRTYSLAEISELKLDYPKAIQRYKKVTQLTPDNLPAWEQVAKLSSLIGNTSSALSAWQQLQHYAKDKKEDRWLMVAQIGEADILATHGHGNSAMEKYLSAHHWFKEQAKRDPKNSDWQRDLSISYDRIGDMHKANGDGDKAIASYQAGLNIAETLAKRDPKNSGLKRDLIVSYVKLSQVFPSDRKMYLQKALDIVLRLKRENRLYPQDFWLVDELKKRLNESG